MPYTSAARIATKRENVSVSARRRSHPVVGAARTRPHWPAIKEQAARNARKKRRAARTSENRGPDQAMSISYLPAAFTTLFVLAASLLLGLY
jgi:hypothetical protein